MENLKAQELSTEEIEKAKVILQKIQKEDMSGINKEDINLALKYIAILEEQKNKDEEKKIITTYNENDLEEESPAAQPQSCSELLSKDDFTLLMEYINTNMGGNNAATIGELIYKGTRDGDNNFHQFVDEKGPTITLIRANDHIFGGFTSINFSSTNTGFKTDSNAFVFSLTDKKKYPVHQPTNYWAIYNVTGTYAFFFGYPSDLIVYNGFLTNTRNQSKVGQCYRLNPNDTNHHSLAGTEFFTINDLEVFTILNYEKIN